jgi:hypothetical protein
MRELTLAGNSGILTFQLQLGDESLQEDIDFGGGFFHTFFDRYWHPFQQLSELDFLLQHRVNNSPTYGLISATYLLTNLREKTKIT